jgi:flagellar basal body-associated protein FliL
MARKVKLDILENREDPIDEQPEEIGPSPLSEVSDSQRPPTVWTGKKWILTSVVVVSVCLIAIGTVMFLMRTGKKDITSLPVKQPPVAMMNTIQRNLSNFDNFVVDYRDGGGNVRIVMFAFTVELNKPVNGDAIEDRVELRGAIYTLSKKKSMASLLFPENRKTFRNEIAAELERRLGAGVVKAIYFTKFYVL